MYDIERIYSLLRKKPLVFALYERSKASLECKIDWQRRVIHEAPLLPPKGLKRYLNRQVKDLKTSSGKRRETLKGPISDQYKAEDYVTHHYCKATLEEILPTEKELGIEADIPYVQRIRVGDSLQHTLGTQNLAFDFSLKKADFSKALIIEDFDEYRRRVHDYNEHLLEFASKKVIEVLGLTI